MSGLSGALCRGRWWLFDSTDPLDHIEAAEICAECPVISACRELLWASTVNGTVSGGGVPSGTWAGQLVGTKAKAREHGTERGWGQHRHYRETVCGSCRLAHNEHVRGQGKPQVKAANRTLERVESGIRRGPDRLRGSDPLTTDSILETNGG